jgi:hypothetical protein
MLRKFISGWVAMIALFGMSGCCSFWEKHCAHPAGYAQPQQAPVYCQPCCVPCAPAPAPAPGGYQPQANWTGPAQRTGYPANCYCP